jgi:hypothetical protein
VLGQVLASQKQVGCRAIGNPLAPQFLHQPVLVRALIALYNLFGWVEYAAIISVPKRPHLRAQTAADCMPASSSWAVGLRL